MTEVFDPVGDHDRRLVAGAEGVLGDLNRAGVLTAADVHVAVRTADLAEERDDLAVLATALATRAVRNGSVGVDLERIREIAPELDWPEPGPWAAAVAGSRLLELGVLRQELGLVYLDRYHRLERQLADDLRSRIFEESPVVDEAKVAEVLAAVAGDHFSEEQIVELTLRTALCGFFNRFNDALQIGMEDGVLEDMLSHGGSMSDLPDHADAAE